MFDLVSSKLFILATVAIIAVGPKDLPVLLRTVGKYLAIVRRHTVEFRARFDEVLREAELQDFKMQIEGVGREMHSALEQGGAITARSDVSDAVQDKPREC
jgi:sec-independent protein translocase protein TatB